MSESKFMVQEEARKRKALEKEAIDLSEHVNDLKASNEYLTNSKLKMETNLALQSVSINLEDAFSPH